MKLTKILHLNFETPLHIHSERADYTESVTRLHSDVIYAALMQLKAVFQLNTSNIDLENGIVDFAISSAFPFTKIGEEKVYFLPRPFKQFDRSKQNEGHWDKREKDLKKVEWIDLDFFLAHQKTEKGLEITNFDWLQNEYLSIKNIKPFVSKQLEPKVRISRTGGDSEPYYLERIYFQENGGFYLIFQGDEKSWSVFQKMMQLLSSEGIGTDRNLGNGLFNISIENDTEVIERFKQLFNVESEFCTNLSLYSPSSKEELNNGLNSNKVGYQLIKRGGWVTTAQYNTLRKRATYFFQEGAIFKMDAKKYDFSIGKTVKLTPDIIKSHEIWRVGKGLFIPIKMEK